MTQSKLETRLNPSLRKKYWSQCCNKGGVNHLKAFISSWMNTQWVSVWSPPKSQSSSHWINVHPRFTCVATILSLSRLASLSPFKALCLLQGKVLTTTAFVPTYTNLDTWCVRYRSTWYLCAVQPQALVQLASSTDPYIWPQHNAILSLRFN